LHILGLAKFILFIPADRSMY